MPLPSVARLLGRRSDEGSVVERMGTGRRGPPLLMKWSPEVGFLCIVSFTYLARQYSNDF